MGQVTPGKARRPATMRSRLASNSLRIVSTDAFGPDTAATAPYCANDVQCVSDCDCSLSNSTQAGLGATAQPTRHPVMAYVFEQPSSVMVRSNMPGRLAGDRWGAPPKRIFWYISSETTHRSWSRARSAMPLTSASVLTPPVGLEGLLSTMALVFFVMAAATASAVMRKPVSATRGTPTGLACAHCTIGS